MSAWQDKIVAVMMAETSDLHELARIAGQDPATFWRDADFRQADLTGQDLTGLDLTAARLPPGVSSAGTKTVYETIPETDGGMGPLEWADARLSVGNQWLAKAMQDWPKAEANLDRATNAMRDAVEANIDAGRPVPMALARKRLAETLLLLADAAPRRAKDAIDSAEYELRVASSALEPEAYKSHWQSVEDARGFVLRRRARRQSKTAALSTLQSASMFHENAASGEDRTIADCAALHALAVQRETISVEDGVEVKRLRAVSFQQLRNWAKVTSHQTANPIVKVSRSIELTSMMTVLETSKDGAPDPQKRADLNERLLKAASQARECDLPLEWAEARRHLELLSSAQLAANQSDEQKALGFGEQVSHVSEAILHAENVFLRGQSQLQQALFDYKEAEKHLENALVEYFEVERLYKIIEESADGLEGPLSDKALLWQGITLLLSAGMVNDNRVGKKLDEARFALDLASAGLSGRKNSEAELAACLDARAFSLRFEASKSSQDDARFLLSEAEALHRRAGQSEKLPRAVTYRYRIHSRGAERERAFIKGRYGKLTDLRHRTAEALKSMQSRKENRSSIEERSAYIAVLSESCLTVRDIARIERNSVSLPEIELATEMAREAHSAAEELFLPLDWLWTLQLEAELREINAT